MQRLIFHVDVNSAFLSWEAARRVAAGEADLRLIPSAIGGDRDKRTGIILAKSIPAKAFGVTTGEPVGMALRKCPQLVLAPPDFRLYSKNSRAFIAICRRYAPVVEQVSIDECFLDMTGTGLLYPDPVAIAHIIKDTIFSELGFTVNVGIAPNKLLAKMASDFEKPDRVHTLFAHEIPQKLWPLPAGSLFSVGRSTAEKLTAARIRTIGDLARTDLAYLQKLTGVRTAALHRQAPPQAEHPILPGGISPAAPAEGGRVPGAGAGAQQPAGAAGALSSVPHTGRGGIVVPAGRRVLRDVPVPGARAVPGTDVGNAAERRLAGAAGGAHPDGAGAGGLCRGAPA